MTHVLVTPKGKVDKTLKDMFGDYEEGVYENVFENEDTSIRLYPILDTYVLKGSDKNVRILVPASAVKGNLEASSDYIKFVQKAADAGDDAFLEEAHALVSSFAAPHMSRVEFYWKPLDVHTASIYNKGMGRSEDVTISIGTVVKEGIPVHIDLLDIFKLCDGKLQLAYMINSIKYIASKKTLIVCAFGKNNAIRGIRVTYLSDKGGPKAFIKGAYACSKGLGNRIQQETENVIRNYFGYLFDSVKPQIRDSEVYRLGKRKGHAVDFELYAVPTAVGFWKHVGFEETGRTKGLTSHMTKRIRIEDRSSGNQRSLV